MRLIYESNHEPIRGRFTNAFVIDDAQELVYVYDCEGSFALLTSEDISAAVQAALDLKENLIVPGTTSQYWRGDKTWQTLDKNAVGLGNVDNTSDLNKPISTATQVALDNITDFAIIAAIALG